jgi:hypothetical protein
MTRVYVGSGEVPPSGFDVRLALGEHIYTGSSDFQQKFGSPTTLESDWLNLAAAVFAVDRGLQRGAREDISRRIELSIPIVNVTQIQPLLPEIERVLRSLSNDSWRLIVRQQNGVPESTFSAQSSGAKTLLFSGGLDSLAAAFEFGGNSNLHLVSHITRNQQTRSTQHELVTILSQSGLTLPHDQFFVSSRDADNFDHDIESTQRTRSFLFMVLGALVARRLGHEKVLMIAENGQLAIHLSLNHARVGAFSTHTAHPDVLAMMQHILRTSLAVTFELLNPYVYRTKSEVIESLWKNLDLRLIGSFRFRWFGDQPISGANCGDLFLDLRKIFGKAGLCYEVNLEWERKLARDPSDPLLPVFLSPPLNIWEQGRPPECFNRSRFLLGLFTVTFRFKGNVILQIRHLIYNEHTPVGNNKQLPREERNRKKQMPPILSARCKIEESLRQLVNALINLEVLRLLISFDRVTEVVMPNRNLWVEHLEPIE